MERTPAGRHTAKVIRLAPYAFGSAVVLSVLPFANVPMPAGMVPLVTLLLGTAPVASIIAPASIDRFNLITLLLSRG